MNLSLAGVAKKRSRTSTVVPRLAAAGFTGIEVGLVPDPARFESADQFEAFLATVILGAHLHHLPPAERRPFVRAVAARLDEPVVDYVRLQIRATRGPDTRS